MSQFNRRDVVKGVSAAAALSLLGSRPSRAEVPQSVLDGAKKEGALLWYDGYAREDGEAVVREFQKSYPFVTKAEYIELPSAQKQARLIQECLAGGPTTDVYLNGASTVQQVVNRDFFQQVNWKELGVPEAAIITPYMVWIATAINCGVYNTNKVTEAEAPKTWEDLLNPKWKGRIGIWQRPSGILYLAPAYGEDKTREYARKFAALQPRLFPGTYQVSQAVGAGELDIGISAAHRDEGRPAENRDPRSCAAVAALCGPDQVRQESKHRQAVPELAGDQGRCAGFRECDPARPSAGDGDQNLTTAAGA